MLISSIRHPCGTLRMRICNLRISHSCCACCPLPIARNRSQQVAVMLTMPLAEAGRAHAMLEEGKIIGKVLLEP